MFVVAIMALFLPFYICLGIWVIELIYFLAKGKLIPCIKDVEKSNWILAFILLIFCVSVFYRNYLGAVCTLAILIIYAMTCYYKFVIDKELFEYCVDLIIYMSIFCALYGLFEYFRIISNFTDDFAVLILNSPENRLNSVFFNANYYAMMIEFFVLMCVYKILSCKNVGRILYYLAIIAMNFVLLYLCGCRTAWPALAISMLVMLFVLKKRRLAGGLILLVGCVFIAFMMFPQYFPRTNNILNYFGIRVDIWKVAIQGIKDHFLFGEGPLTYFHIYYHYANETLATQHAHSLYLDPFLSFGIVGVSMLVYYAYGHFKSFIQVYKQGYDPYLMALIIGTIVTTLVHGLLDYTVFFVQTGFVFLMIISSYHLYEKKRS